MLEVGTVVFERFVIGRNWELTDSDCFVYGAAFGIERIAMLVSGVHDITEIPELRPMVEQLEADLDSRLVAICKQQVRGVIDGIRTLIVIRSQVQELDRRRRQRVKAVARRVGRYFTDLGVEDVAGQLSGRLCAIAASGVAHGTTAVDRVLGDLEAANDPPS